MDQAFWHARWQANEIGFHQTDINLHLQTHWSALQVKPGSRVLVPLCGKSRDMLWLAGQGYSVLGVEISPIAVAAFFAENDLRFETTRDERFVRRAAQEIELWEGDFFALRPSDLRNISAVFDRASLIALPPEMRRRYAQAMVELLPAGTAVLLVTLDYPQSQMEGPPFAVQPAEVVALYAGDFNVEPLTRLDILAENPRFRDRGLTALTEHVFKLTRL